MREFSLPVAKLLGLSSDGPNVNKTIWRNVSEMLKEQGFPGLMSFIPCNLHVIHNAFRKGLDIFGAHAESLAIDLFYWFKSSAARREDWSLTMAELELDEKLFIRHIESRWQSLIPAFERIIVKWDATKQHFLEELPKNARESKCEKQLTSNERYRRISHKLGSKILQAQLHFLCSVGPLFQKMPT